MIHLGDITKIHGYDAPAVDCIIGGSPCQDLSIAGNRAGLQGERSGLFMEQIRIIKEMRERDKSAGRAGQYVRPRYMVWENVPGAFSSHKGNDFAAVLEETVHIIEPEAPPIPVPKKGWPTSGCLMGAEWSLAWRVFDAQFWGVPQRRKRIALVADFGGESAPEILFERKGLSWNPNKSRPEGKTIAESAQNRSAGNDRMAAMGGADAYTLKIRSGCEGGGKGSLIQTEKTGTLSTRQDQTLFQLIAEPTFCISGNTVDRETNQNGTGVRENGSFTVNTVDRHAVAYAIDCRNLKAIKEVSGTLQAKESGGYSLNYQNPVAYKEEFSQPKAVFDARGNGDGNITPTITGDHESRITDYTAIAVEHAGCLTPWDVQSRRNFSEYGKWPALYSGEGGGHGYVFTLQWIVRRLTPMECERLQGYPDGWTDIGEWTDTKGRKHELKDSPRYKALGNSIALPSWKWVLKRLCAQYERDATMASLFDGIGGFPLIWEQFNGKGSCLWASEIEEFPIAVTKIHFPEKAGENNG